MKPSIVRLLFSLASTAVSRGTTTPVPCESVAASPIPGATILNTTGVVRQSDDLTPVPICDVSVYLTHDDVGGDEVLISIWLPLDRATWNTRFQGTGGGGYNVGLPAVFLPLAVAQGYAAAATNGGVPTSPEGDPAPWAHRTELYPHFVHLALHEMTVVGKDITTQYYGRPPSYSYWHGCSTGGRQGYAEAQRWPEDYDGILANAPAINWDTLGMALFWPFILQSRGEQGFVDACKLVAITNASVAACDSLDGAEEGLLANPPDCTFEASSVVGEEVQCNGTTSVITEYEASIWQGIRDGPRGADGELLWYGLPPGTPLFRAAAPPPGTLVHWHITRFLLQDPDYDISSIDYEMYWSLWEQSRAEFGPLWGTDNPDLSEFKQRGGKLLTWHGWADDVIHPESTIDYWERVIDTMGGEAEVDSFYRLFMAPGVEHCAGGVGPEPTNPLSILVDWVENGVVPETLPAASRGQSRNLCKHPRTLAYTGYGNVSDADSWTCV